MLSITEKYMVVQTMELYNQILFTKFYKLLWRGQTIVAAWDVRNELIVSLLVGELGEEEIEELSDIIYNKEIDNVEEVKRKERKIRAEKLREERKKKNK